MSYLFTSESVSEGHPDKVADQISDALLDEFLRRDPQAHVACETLVTTGLVALNGEIRTRGYVDVQQVARRVINQIGYTKAEYMFDGNSCGVISTIHEQSPDISQGVVREVPEDQGAGDQGIMFGYACRETQDYMPLSIALSHMLLQELTAIRREGKVMTYLRPDAKSQVTLEYSDEGKALRVDTVVISTQHDEFAEDEVMSKTIFDDVKNILIPRTRARLAEQEAKLFGDDYKLYVNPTGKFVIGGPHGDTGLTGRKIIVDTYGGHASHGGGAFSGKDPSKVDRSAAYAARYVAKNLVAAGVADEAIVQLAYAIGIAKPVSIMVNTKGTAKVQLTDGQIAQKVMEIFDLRPSAIIKQFGLLNPIYLPTAAYGHFGRTPYTQEVEFLYDGKAEKREVQFFGWEKLDAVEKIAKAFNL
ncbi:MAG: methionine adenosyltransferase [Bacteroidetes bacterium]|nr:MAG: methionine adenosyltransferase [Bacteroidota bacterium]